MQCLQKRLTWSTWLYVAVSVGAEDEGSVIAEVESVSLTLVTVAAVERVTSRLVASAVCAFTTGSNQGNQH